MLALKPDYSSLGVEDIAVVVVAVVVYHKRLAVWWEHPAYVGHCPHMEIDLVIPHEPNFPPDLLSCLGLDLATAA